MADGVAALVIDEMCVSVGRQVRARAQELQENMAMRLGVTLIEEEEFARRVRDR